MVRIWQLSYVYIYKIPVYTIISKNTNYIIFLPRQKNIIYETKYVSVEPEMEDSCVIFVETLIFRHYLKEQIRMHGQICHGC